MRYPNAVSLACGVIGLAIGMALLLAWQYEGWKLLRPVTGAPSVAPLTVINLCVLALTVIAAALQAEDRATLTPARVGALVIGLLQTVVLFEYGLGTEGGIEKWFWPEKAAALGGTYPGRPALHDAWSLLMLGAALWHFGTTDATRDRLLDVCVGAALFLPVASLVGYLFQASDLFRFAVLSGSGMAIPSALVLIVLGVGTLNLRHGDDVARVGTDDRNITRRLMPAVVLVPVFAGLLQVHTVRTGIFEFTQSVAMVVTAFIGIYTILVIWIGRLVARVESERVRAMREREQAARLQALTDVLTGLGNRRSWEERLAREEQRCATHNCTAAIVVVDLDGLKQVNDTQGHEHGDQLLRRTAAALSGAIREGDTLARTGGDEFGLLTVNGSVEVGMLMRRRVREALNAAGVAASVGMAMRGANSTLQQTWHAADAAMYDDKMERRAQRAQPQTA